MTRACYGGIGASSGGLGMSVSGVTDSIIRDALSEDSTVLYIGQSPGGGGGGTCPNSLGCQTRPRRLFLWSQWSYGGKVRFGSWCTAPPPPSMRQARLEPSGGSTPDLLRPPHPQMTVPPGGWGGGASHVSGDAPQGRGLRCSALPLLRSPVGST